jgi:hypothetical protein
MAGKELADGRCRLNRLLVVHEMSDVLEHVHLGVGELSLNSPLCLNRRDVIVDGGDEENGRFDVGGVVRNSRGRRHGERGDEDGQTAPVTDPEGNGERRDEQDVIVPGEIGDMPNAEFEVDAQ